MDDGRWTSAAVSRSRRRFIREATGACLAAALLPSHSVNAQTRRTRKAVIVTFGGGARDDETFRPEGQQNIPHLLGELLPQATFFTQVVNRGILGHYVANASLATGAYETLNNFVAAPPQHPTVFEYFRKDLKRPSSDAWVIAPSMGFERIGESVHSAYGPGWVRMSYCRNACWRRRYLWARALTTSRCCTITTNRRCTSRKPKP